MAEKSGPPPPYQYQSGGATAYPGATPYPSNATYPKSGTTVVIQQGYARPPPTNHGIFGSINKELNAMGNMVQREMNWVGKQIDTAVKVSNTCPILNNFMTNNQIQVISKASGRSLQIVQSPNGQLVVDGNGGVGPQFYNAVWTVINEGNNQVRLHNNNNYLVIANGHTSVMHMPPGAMQGVETKFQLGTKGANNNFVTLESMKERGRHVGILNDGSLKPASATGTEDHAQFGINLIYSPYQPAGAQPKK